MKNRILCVKNVVCGYGRREVLRDINLCIERGEVLGIIGPNGSGKTTLLRAVSHSISLQSGSIEYNGRLICNMSRKQIAQKIAFVLQSHEHVFAKMTVEQMVALGRIPHFTRFQWAISEKDISAVEEAMRTTDVLHLKDRGMDKLSGGEMQRVFLARALAQEPELLLLDEPTMHLDISHAIEIFKIITRLMEDKKTTVLCVMHDLNLASRYCKRLVMIHKGEIVHEGTPGDVIKRENISQIYSADVNIYTGDLSTTPQILY